MGVQVYYSLSDGSSHSLVLPKDEVGDFVENALEPDVMEGGVGEMNLFWGAERDAGTTMDATVDVSETTGAERGFFSYELETKASAHTIAWLKERHPEVKLSPLGGEA